MPTGYSKHDSELALPICRTTYKLNNVCNDTKLRQGTKINYDHIVPLHIVRVKQYTENIFKNIFRILCSLALVYKLSLAVPVLTKRN